MKSLEMDHDRPAGSCQLPSLMRLAENERLGLFVEPCGGKVGALRFQRLGAPQAIECSWARWRLIGSEPIALGSGQTHLSLAPLAADEREDG
jgi:hypothetical protein